MHSIGQSIKSPLCPCVRAYVRPTFLKLSSLHLLFSFLFHFPFFFPFSSLFLFPFPFPIFPILFPAPSPSFFSSPSPFPCPFLFPFFFSLPLPLLFTFAAVQFEIKLFDFFYRSKRLADYIYTDIYCKLSKCIEQTLTCSYEHYLVYLFIIKQNYVMSVFFGHKMT